VNELVSLVLRNRVEEEEVIDASHYSLEADSQRPLLRPVGSALPSVPLGGVIEITFVAGFSEDWDGLPADLAQAVILLAAHYYENRFESGEGEARLPMGVSCLIERYRTVRLLGAGRR
jgi:uncharacterized phiE125 gp8 family phage protein